MISTQRKALIIGLQISMATLYASDTFAATGITALTLEQLEQEQATLIQRTPAYVDNLIDSTTAEDAAPSPTADTTLAEESASGYRTLNMGIDTRHTRTDAGDTQTRQALNLDASRQTRDYGTFTLDTQVTQQNTSASTETPPETQEITATLYQNDWLLNDEWQMDNTVGVVRSAQNSLISQSNNLSLPSRTYLGSNSRISNDKTEVRLMHGKKGEVLDNGDITTTEQAVTGLSVTHRLNEQWAVGAQGWQAQDEDAQQHQEATLAVQHTNESGSLQTKAQMLTNEAGSGAWVDTEYQQDRFRHQAGAYALGDGLTWMGDDVADNTQGAYWRMGYTHPRYDTHSSIEWQQRQADAETHDTQELRLNQSLNYQYDRTTRTGGQLSHTQTQAADDRQQTQGSVFVSRSWSSGQDSRLQLRVSHEQEPDTTTQTREIDYSHHWLLPAANELSWQINARNEQDEAEDRNTYQTGLDWQHHLSNGDNVGANLTLSKASPSDNDLGTHQNYRVFARKQLNSKLNLEASIEQTHDTEGKRDQGVSVALNYQDGWGKPLGRRDVRSGGIRGVVFFDENNDGRQQPLEKKAANIELVLDGRTPVTTDQNGEFAFPQVATGAHELEVAFSSIPLPWELSADFNTKVEVGLRDTSTLAIPLAKVTDQ
ncbi:hypothetical protein HMY34_07680 [Thiothrix subterranea]|uniref:hypothetical protein n=1 Tax=Thiothrix subterranea TaxID=2735563 RepID=UPI00192B1FA9|nr:hypothetical protein [Thiothrix subterranea]QQZ28641.1 hypothetical protein HMY34_07680 [Thiothrix subterranea]